MTKVFIWVVIQHRCCVNPLLSWPRCKCQGKVNVTCGCLCSVLLTKTFILGTSIHEALCVLLNVSFIKQIFCPSLPVCSLLLPCFLLWCIAMHLCLLPPPTANYWNSVKLACVSSYSTCAWCKQSMNPVINVCSIVRLVVKNSTVYLLRYFS